MSKPTKTASAAKYCVNCGTAMPPGSSNCRDCGWMPDGGQTTKDSYPTLNTLVQEIQARLSAWREHERPWPAKMPHPLSAAADWWITLMGRPCPFEAPNKVSLVGGGHRWDWAYRDRVINCLKVFLAMPPEHQGTVLAGIEDRVPWRGEPIDTYLRIVHEHLHMAEVGREEYIRQARQRAREMLKGAAHGR